MIAVTISHRAHETVPMSNVTNCPTWTDTSRSLRSLLTNVCFLYFHDVFFQSFLISMIARNMMALWYDSVDTKRWV